MTMNEDFPPPAKHRSFPGRRQVAAGAAGLAVVLGAVGYLISEQNADRGRTTAAPDRNVTVPVTPTVAEPAPVPSASPTAAGSAPAKPATSAASPAKSLPEPTKSRSVRDEIEAARAAAAKDGIPLRRPLPAAEKRGPIEERTEQTAEGILRVVTARFDLTGHKPLSWAGDQGKAVGEVRCTQSVRLSRNEEPRVRPSMLLCWRTSAGRSVAIVAVARQGKPSEAAGVAAIDREWARLS